VFLQNSMHGLVIAAWLLGQNDVGVDWVFTRGKTRRGMASRQLATTVLLLESSSAVHGHSKAAPASRSSPTSSSWPPHASRPVEWLQSVTNSLNLVAARVWRVLSFTG
jgi:hypothetical protein